MEEIFEGQCYTMYVCTYNVYNKNDRPRPTAAVSIEFIVSSLLQLFEGYYKDHKTDTIGKCTLGGGMK